MLVTYRLRDGLPSLRGSVEFRWIRFCLASIAGREEFRVVHFSAQANHLHLIVEADDERALASGLRSFAIRMTKRLNAHWGRRGAILTERYHARVLRTPREVRNALAYVLKNFLRHDSWESYVLDPYSSAAWFDGWVDAHFVVDPLARAGPPPVAEARTWLLRVGWRRHGKISPYAPPGRRARGSRRVKRGPAVA